MTEKLLIRLDPEAKKKLENDAWLKKMSMAEYLRALIYSCPKIKVKENA